MRTAKQKKMTFHDHEDELIKILKDMIETVEYNERINGNRLIKSEEDTFYVTPEQAKEITGVSFSLQELKDWRLGGIIKKLELKIELNNEHAKQIRYLTELLEYYVSGTQIAERLKTVNKRSNPESSRAFLKIVNLPSNLNIMEPEREEEEIGIVMLTFLSQGELTQVQKIAAKEELTEKEFLFVMQLAGRTARIPLEPLPPGIEVLIRQEYDQFSIVRVNQNVHLQN